MTTGEQLANGFTQYINEAANLTGEQYRRSVAALRELRAWAALKDKPELRDFMDTVIGILQGAKKRQRGR